MSASAHDDAVDPGPEAFRALLHEQRVWDPRRTTLPALDPARVPGRPLPLFRQWFAEAADAGQPEPHAVSLATADADGTPDARIVVLHGAEDPGGFSFATHADSRKGRQLGARPYAALCFYWPVLGRQVRVRGPVAAAPHAEALADLHAHSPGALAAALTGRQSEPVDSPEALRTAAEAAWTRAQEEPEADAPDWTLYHLAPEEVEFFQGEQSRRHVRVRYTLHADGWARELLWP
ncbi:pyridoxal 5'-phosphate synthase [Streptomyces sp. DSM 41982]|uniref:Pyridoxal 5'-phosphate synthase n=1 Tax=Streptomyces evansiae TaxID=3075535 RepID=A0ABD5EET4_9ACTN|nr:MULTISPECIES: pyridoxal 5'-phosphate synthase [unclassified Streptomyces]MDT0419302.1 pyridoxal 5'-phosphate synthase [Streptomyces sp. DSM 41982]SCD33919.1 Pyridoxamine 5'-phosphate oxidase [Streptomyces sp. SolWspMP-sol7th]